MGRIIIYTTTGCPYSLKVKNIFEKKAIQFTEINLTEFPTVVDELADWSKGKRSIPQIFFEDEFIGGLDELQTLHSNGKLDDLIKKIQEAPNGHNRTLPKSRRKTLAPWKNLKLDPVLEDVFKRLRDKTNGLALKNRFQNSHTFKGSALIKWLTVNNKSTEEEALRMAEKLRTKGYFYRIKEGDKPIANDSSLFRFYADDNPDVLNGRMVYAGDSRSALDIALYLQDTINTIYEGHINLDDGNVDYEKIKKLKEYTIFCDNLIELHKADLSSLKTKEAILFYLAMYKVLLLHGEIVLGYKPKSKADKAKLYQQYSYNIGGQNYTLEAFEGILRGKPKASSGSDQIRKMLSRKEMTKVAGLSKADPRIHFAMISCDKFSQPIRFLDSKNMDSALQWATELFCADIEVSFRSKSVNLPLLFKEYRTDFGKTNKEVLSWVVMFLPDDKEEKVRQLLATVPEEAITLNFRKRGWEVDRIFGDLEETEEEEVKINQRNTGDSDDLSAAKGETKENLNDEDDDAYFNYEPVSKELLDKFNEVFSTNATTLELKDSGLKYLPKELGKGKKMDACKKVVITDNQLTMLPRWFAVTFTNLTILYINGNKLRTVPANLADIKQLETVDLSNNLISLIPNRFCTLRNLRALNLSGNNLEFLPVGFAQLRQLEELLLAHNQLAELRDNFGELSKLEILDISHNRLAVLPDSVANFKRLEEFNLRGNRLKELPATIEQLSSLVLLDLSHNDLKELPSELGGMSSLTELYLANNKLKKLSKGFCDLNCSVVDLEENPLVDPPKDVCNEGIEAIRKHFNWTKPSARNAPRSRTSSANLQAELDRSQSASSLQSTINDGTTPRDLKRLSTHEKRALLIKRVVVKKFDPTKLNEIRATVQNQDITTVLAAAAAAEEERRKERQAQNLDSSEDGQGQSPPKEDQFGRTTEIDIPTLTLDKITASGTSPNLTRRIAQLIAPTGGFRIDRNEGKMLDIDDLQLQEFNFIFDYGNDFFGKPHYNFIGVSKEYGAILISILREGEEDEPEEKERKLFGTLKFKRKAKSPSVPNFFSRVQSKDKMMKKKPSTDNLKANAIDSPAASMDSPSLQKRSSQANLASNLSTSTFKDSARSEHKDSARSDRLDTPKEEKPQHSPRKSDPKEDKPMPSPRSIKHNSSNSSMTAATSSHDEDSETHETSEDNSTPRDEKDKSEKDKDKSGRPSLHRSRSRSIEPGNNSKLMKSKSRDLKREKEKVMLKRQMMLSSVKEERKNVTMSGDFDMSSASKKQSKRNSTEIKDPKEKDKDKDGSSGVRFSRKDSSSSNGERDATPPKITKKPSRLTMTSSEKKDKDKEKDKDKDKDRDRDSHISEDKKIDEKDEESYEQGSKNMTKTRSSRQLGISAIGGRRKTSMAGELTAEKQKSEAITPRTAAAAEAATPSALNLLIRVRKSDRRLKMSLKNFQSTGRVSRMKPKQMVKLLKDEYPEYSGITFKQIKNEDMEQELLNMELRLMVKGYKYGILYAKEGQVEEEKMFCNNDPSPDFTEFLEFLADKIELKGWEAYNGGLDVQQGMTGKHSYFTKFKDYSIMFHVSTELPFTEGDPQQIERKRHLGNDIVVIVFQEGDTPFNPTCVHSYFNHVFFVVRKEPNNEGKTMYRVSITSKSGVAPHLPLLPDPPVFEKGPHFREYFFTKLINAERASYSAPGFAYAIENTRGQLIQQIVDNYYFD